MRDAAADPSRRAWLPCTSCAKPPGCHTCLASQNCSAHWLFLLAADGPLVFVQCPNCLRRWWHDTAFGSGNRPEQIDHLEFEVFAS